MYVFLSVLLVALLLLANEHHWRNKTVHAELPRKVVHIMVGSFIAFWPLYISWNWIRLISLAFILGVIISKSLNIFASIHEVERFSIGEICFALAVGGMTFFTKTDWIYAVALLQMSIADGLAAIVGVHLGKSTRYKIFGATKSLVGSAAFLITSLLILFIASLIIKTNVSFLLIILTALAATIVENLAVYGLDNLFIPLTVILILNHY
jgi:dolichol kinase